MTASPRYPLTMIVDDNELDSFVLKNVLTANGFAAEAVLMPDGHSALDYLKANASERLPRIIFLDIMMPHMDGFAFLEEINKLSDPIKKNSKVIMLSTSESFKDLNRANQSKYVYKFLNKPLNKLVLDAIQL